MKHSFLSAILLLLCLAWLGIAKADDLPPPTANIETIPAGAWVLAMDNTHQGISGVMNLKAYGLATELLWNDIPLKWVIKTGKGKDSFDMRRTLSQEIIPTYQAPPLLPGVNFESCSGCPYLPTLAYTGTGTVNTTTGKYNGARSYRMTRNQTITTANILIDQYIDVVCSVAFASIGPDAGENLTMDISYDNGVSWPDSVRLVSGNGTSLNINQTSTNTVTPNPYKFNVPESATQVRVRFRVTNAASMTTSEFYYVDDIIFTGTYVRNFYSGPMIIMAEDTSRARPVIEAFNAPLAAAEKVNLFVMTGPKAVDVRYTLGHKPYIAIYDDGGNAIIHESILTTAGIGASRYDILNPGDIIDSSSCYTFSSTPHWAVTSYSHDDSVRLFNLQEFLLSGGNFFAQCEGIDAIENFTPVRYQSTNGFETISASVTSLVYGNPDMPLMQIQGIFTPSGGSVPSYRPTPGVSNWSAIHYFGYYFNATVGGVNSNIAISSGTKYAHPDSIGGNIFYLGGHNYNGSGLGDVNGRRAYLNSIFVPARRLIATGILTPSMSVCQGDTIKLNFTAPSTGYTFVWSGPNGFTSVVEKPKIPNAQNIHAGQYRATITTREGCQYTYTTTVTINPKPDINATSATPAICLGQDCELTFSPSTNISSATWYYRDSTQGGCIPGSTIIGTDLDGQTITPTYTSSYAVVAVSDRGCLDTSCFTIVVDHPPILTSPFPTATPLCYAKGVSATIVPGSGGSSCTETYQWRQDGGAWQAYTSGAVVGTTATDTVEIKATRNCLSGCTDKIVGAGWDVAAPYLYNAIGNFANCADVSGYIGQLRADDPAPAIGIWTKTAGPGTVLDVNDNETIINGLSTTGTSTSLKWVVTDKWNCKDSSTMTLSPPVVDASNVSKYDNDFCLTCPVKNGDLYYFYDLNGKLLAAVEDVNDAVNLGQTEFCARLTYPLPGNPATTDVPLVPADYAIVQPYLPRYWSVNSAEAGETDVRLFFTDEELSALMGYANGGSIYSFNNVNALMITAYTNPSPGFITPGSPGGISITPTFLRVGNYWQVSFSVPSSSTFYLHPVEFGNAPLPIELLSFKAVALEKSILLNWVTASELNSERFEVERSLDGVHFVKIGQLPAAGNSNRQQQYNLEDGDVQTGIVYYYRIRAVDLDGKTAYSKIASASLNGQKSRLEISDFSPNPTRGSVKINIVAPDAISIKFRLLSLDGRVILEKDFELDKGNAALDFDIGQVPAGSYFGQFTSQEGKEIRKLIKIE